MVCMEGSKICLIKRHQHTVFRDLILGTPSILLYVRDLSSSMQF